MLDYEALRDQLIPFHGVVGLLAMIAGTTALAIPKRAPLHPWAGRTFMITMCVAIAISAPVIAASRNVFLLGVGLLVIYHVVVAWRLAWLSPPVRLPQRFDRWIHPVFAVAFVAFAVYGVLVLLAGAGMGLVAIVLSAISLVAVRHFSRFMSQAEFEPKEWIGEHIRGVAAAFIASMTAFTAAAGPRLAPAIPHPVLWLGPTLVLTPLFIWFGNAVQLERRRERERLEAQGQP